MPRVIELTYTAWDLEGRSRRTAAYHGEPFSWDEERRFQLRCELDAATFTSIWAPASGGTPQANLRPDFARLKEAFRRRGTPSSTSWTRSPSCGRRTRRGMADTEQRNDP